jgi:hypothetical protein
VPLAVAGLPRDAVVAAFPSETSDSIPYLTRRSVFVAHETHMPFHTRYTELMRERMRALIHAYFATSAETLRDFRDRQGVTHLLVDRRNFETHPNYFAPFGPDLDREFAAGRASGFSALALAGKLGVFESRNWVLLDLRKL